jgi:hypothetical protein
MSEKEEDKVLGFGSTDAVLSVFCTDKNVCATKARFHGLFKLLAISKQLIRIMSIAKKYFSQRCEHIRCGHESNQYAVFHDR